jgi:deoxyinosine 3'endonuclease (endonuclease V)
MLNSRTTAASRLRYCAVVICSSSSPRWHGCRPDSLTCPGCFVSRDPRGAGRAGCTADLRLCDGQGLAHPRRFGLTCQLGWLVDVPTFGVARSRLLGEYTPPPAEHGAWSSLWDRGELVGAAVRTRRGVKPLFVSPGHRVDVASAVRLTLACTHRYRLPEPSRTAHRLASDS